jgi:hypothetical protein
MKQGKILLLILVVWGGFFTATSTALAQGWTQSYVDFDPWTAVASSANGATIVGVITNGPIYYSTNSGFSWQEIAGYPNAYFRYYLTGVASSEDGTVLAVTAGHSQAGPIIISTNSGGAWFTNAPNEFWTCIASSASGSQLVAAATNGVICISTNAGGTWALSLAPVEDWVAISSSGDGSQLAVVATNSGPVCVSTNGGNTWMTNNTGSQNSVFSKSPGAKPHTEGSAPNTNWQAVACSADKSKLVAAVKGGLIYISTNAGTAWSPCNVPSTNWQSVACSADGTIMIAAVNKGLVYTSMDEGTTWVTNNVPTAPWIGVSASADGSKLVAAAGPISLGRAPIYTLQSTPTPHLNLQPAGGNIGLSWILPATNFVLQQSADLASWTTLTNPPTLNLSNLQNQVTLYPTNSSSFYRLKTP